MSAVDLRALALTDVREPIPKEAMLAAFQTPPFVYVPGTFNTRDLGLSIDPTGKPGVRPGFAYRSGDLSRLTDAGKGQLTDALGVRTIFDLRTGTERSAGPDPDVPGVRNVWTPAREKDAVVDLAAFVDGNGDKGCAAMYADVLRDYADPIAKLLAHVRDRPDEPFLFHCTAGRDRTGVVAGMLKTLAGADGESVTDDFLLSRIGTEPAREQLLAFALRGSGAESTDAPGFVNLITLRVSGWEAFVGHVEAEYGGFEGYARTTLGFSEADITRIKRNLAETP